jgi:hypothetical protein
VDFDPVRAKAQGSNPALPKPLADLFPDSFGESELGEIPKGWTVSEMAMLVRRAKSGAGLAPAEVQRLSLRIGKPPAARRKSYQFALGSSKSPPA